MAKTSLQTAIAANAEWTRAQRTTAVFTGATSGIGEYTIRALAAHYSKSTQILRLYVVGRNKDAATTIISDCRKICPSGDFRFVQATDLSLLSEVDVACEEIKRLESDNSGGIGTPGSIDLLVMSHADFHIGGRRETVEGLDKSISMLYYSRMRFVVNLLPLLRASGSSHVISVFGAGLENLKDWDPADMSLRNVKRYSMSTARTHVVVMKTLFMEKLAAQENTGKIAFIHVFPGVVITPAFGSQTLPRWFKALWFVVEPIVKRTIAISSDEIGERILFLSSQRYSPQNSQSDKEKDRQSAELGTNGIPGGGAYACKHDGETVDVQSKYTALRKQNVDQKVWDHTMAVFREIEEGRVFKG